MSAPITHKPRSNHSTLNEPVQSQFSGWVLAVFFTAGLVCHWGVRLPRQPEPIRVSQSVPVRQLSPVRVAPQREEPVSIDDWLGLKPKVTSKPKLASEVNRRRKSPPPETVASTDEVAPPETSHPTAAPLREDDRDGPHSASSPPTDQPAPTSLAESELKPEEPPGDQPLLQPDVGVISEFSWDPLLEAQPSQPASGPLFPAPAPQPTFAHSQASPRPLVQSEVHGGALLPAAARPDRMATTANGFDDLSQPPEAGIGEAAPVQVTRYPATAQAQPPAAQYPSTGQESVLAPMPLQPVPLEMGRPLHPPRRPAIYEASGSPAFR